MNAKNENAVRKKLDVIKTIIEHRFARLLAKS